MPAIEEAQGKGDKLQSAPGVNLVREVLELFTVLQKSFKDAPIGEEIVRSGACFAHKTQHNTRGARRDRMALIPISSFYRMLLEEKMRSGQSRGVKRKYNVSVLAKYN